jgi:hypothetical protein
MQVFLKYTCLNGVSCLLLFNKDSLLLKTPAYNHLNIFETNTLCIS